MALTGDWTLSLNHALLVGAAPAQAGPLVDQAVSCDSYVFEQPFAQWEAVPFDYVLAYLVNMDEWERYNEVWKRYFPANKPARATVEVSRLRGPVRIEIDLIAALPDG